MQTLRLSEVVAPIHEEKQNCNEERADGCALEEVVHRQVPDRDRQLNNRNQMQHHSNQKCEQRVFEESGFAPQQHGHGVKQPHPI